MRKILLIALLFGNACSDKKTNTAKENCIDPDKIDPQRMCTMDYNPVCGCDNKTYSNACVAESRGVTRWTMGECKEE